MIWGVVGGFTAVLLEILYRKGLGWSWPGVLVALPLAILVSYCVSRLVQSPGSFITAVVWFGAATALARIGAAFWILGDPLTVKTAVAAVALMVAAAVKLW